MASLQQFTQGVVESGLVTEEELRQYMATLPPDLKHPSAEQLSQELVMQGAMTEFQTQQILDGKSHLLILGNNIILDHLGSGGMGEVFKAEHRMMKRPVAIKVLHQKHVQSEYILKRFLREVETAAKLYHPNVVTAFDADKKGTVHFLVMEYVDGVDLGQLIERQGPLSLDQALDCTIQAARGLAYAHQQGVIHRDIKPGNLLLDTQGVVKVSDMGLARLDELAVDENTDSNGETITQANQILGTVDYMAPEQADDSASVARRADIYSLGCTFYRLLTGQAPYHEIKSTLKKLMAHRADPIPPLQNVRPEAPDSLENAYQKMVAKEPSDRFASMAEVVRALEACRRELPALAGVPQNRQPTQQQQPEVTVDMQAAGDDTKLGFTIASSPESIEPTGPAVGIDLGTTYSVVSYLDSEGRPQTLTNAEGDKTTPSVLLFEDDDVVVGKEAVKAMSTEMIAVAECAKRDLGERFFRKQFTGRSFPPETLQAWVLNKLRQDAWASIGPHSKVVVTVPAYFDEVRRKATQDAGYMAGFEVMDIINEPTAAAVAFGFQQGYLHPESQAGKSQKVLVYDLGGGTFDVTVMEICGTDYTTVATDGDFQLGGRDWDQRLVDYAAEEFIRLHGLDPREDPNASGRLWRECEDAKRTLSARSKASITCDYRGYSVRCLLTRQMFEEMTRDLLDRTAFTTKQTLKAAKLAWKDISRVLLIGGSTRMPAVRAMLRRLSGSEPDSSVAPDEAVAHGAALHAGLLLDRRRGQAPRFQIRNVNSHSLGVAGVDPQTKRKQTAVLIPRNTQLPAAAKKIFHTSKPGQTSVKIQIVEGESSDPDDCAQIGHCAVRDLPPNLPAHTPVEVAFHYEENGRLQIRVRVAGGKDLHHEIIRENTLTPAELDQWRRYISGLPPRVKADDDESASTEMRPLVAN